MKLIKKFQIGGYASVGGAANKKRGYSANDRKTGGAATYRINKAYGRGIGQNISSAWKSATGPVTGSPSGVPYFYY